MKNQQILEILLDNTNLTEITPENIVLALSCCSWNYTIYKGQYIYLKGKKVGVSPEDITFMRSGIDAYNADKPAYRHISF
jgi:hypothetical protein